jgi:polynucleotide 5'-kinase involved in rRNA processing
MISLLLHLNTSLYSENVQPRLLVAGGKGVGKSTLVRFLVNRLLTELGGPVLVVDLDPGQAEFSVPGRVVFSLTLDDLTARYEC